MRKKLLKKFYGLAFAMILLLVTWVIYHQKNIQEIHLAKFGSVVVTENLWQTNAVAIILIDDQKLESKMATAISQELAKLNILSAIVDKSPYVQQAQLKSKTCFNAGSELISLSQAIQQTLKMKEYFQPIVIDLSKGLSIGERAFLEAPGDSFSGLVSRQKCDLEKTLPANFCKDFTVAHSSNILNRLLASSQTPKSWLLVGEKKCTQKNSKLYHSSLQNEFLPDLLPTNYISEFNWVHELAENIEHLPRKVSSEKMIGLSVIEKIPEKIKSSYFVILYSGDGGWAEFDESLANAYVEHGIPVIGIDSLKYFWKKKDPKKAGQDLSELIQSYQNKLKLQSFSLVGFSFGADVMPFLIDALPSNQRRQIRSVNLLALSEKVEFEFHFTDWLASNDDGVPILPQIEKLSDLKIKCLYGSEETLSLCPRLTPGSIQVFQLPGDHHFDGRTDSIISLIE